MYTAKDFKHLLGLPGFSDTMLTNHFTLYEGYVKNTNLLMEKLDTLEASTPEYYELRRRLGWEFDGMRMHELYFANMTKENQSFSADSVLGKKVVATWGSFDAWKESFSKLGTIRGIGWVVLLEDNATKELFHAWIGDHHEGHMVDTTMLLAMDCWEHAYITDYGIKRADYIASFIPTIDWTVVEKRLGTK
ncbi:MAG: Fe-Mn family superoxide dismutase [Candidatus Moranbacteria bacterium]|nr:Fe-Mn family superoxide dismutase [Candidatus Moranbacteria bacterium]